MNTNQLKELDWNSITEKYMKENDLYNSELVEIMKEYGLISEEDGQMIEDYLFSHGKGALAK